MEVTLKLVGRDYLPLPQITFIDESGYWDNLMSTLDEMESVKAKTELVEVFLQKVNASKLYINRGSERKSENISLLAKFRSTTEYIDEESENNVSEEEDASISDPDANISEPDANISEADAIEEAQKYLSVPRLNGIVGALSGTVSSAELKHPVFTNLATEPVEFTINLQIKSRMDDENHSFFVAKLLTYGNITTHSERVYDTDDCIFDFLLIDLFANNLSDAIPKGIYRTYQRFSKNDDRLKGTIDFARHIKLNGDQDTGRVAYTYRENSPINDLNKLIIVAYRYLKIKYPELVAEKIDNNIQIKTFLNELQLFLQNNIPRIPEAIADNARPIAHPYFTEYEEVRKVCLMILRDEGVSVFDASDGNVHGFLFYLPDLWEIFLEHYFDKIFASKDNIFAFTQRGKKFIEKNDGGFACNSRPDFVFNEENNRNAHSRLVLDAKYKEEWEKAIDPKSGKGKALSTYCGEDINKVLRDMVVAGSQGCGIIFPRKNKTAFDNPEELYKGVTFKRKISNINDTQFFYIIPVDVPSNEGEISYEAWDEKFEESLSKLSEILLGQILW